MDYEKQTLTRKEIVQGELNLETNNLKKLKLQTRYVNERVKRGEKNAEYTLVQQKQVMDNTEKKIKFLENIANEPEDAEEKYFKENELLLPKKEEVKTPENKQVAGASYTANPSISSDQSESRVIRFIKNLFKK